MITYIENPRGSIDKLLELVRTFHKIVDTNQNIYIYKYENTYIPATKI